MSSSCLTVGLILVTDNIVCAYLTISCSIKSSAYCPYVVGACVSTFVEDVGVYIEPDYYQDWQNDLLLNQLVYIHKPTRHGFLFA